MKKKSLLVLFLLTVAFFAYATDYVDVVKTKDGDVYKGIIVENKINEYIRIELPGGTTFKIKYNKIDSLLKEAVQAKTSSGNIIINNANTNTQTQTNSNGNAPAGNPYTSYELNELFKSKSLGSLKTVRIDRNRMSDTKEDLRYSVYDTNRKKGSGWVFLGNLLLPGVGSFIQGDTGMGFYDSLSCLAYIVSAISYSNQVSEYYSENNNNYYQHTNTPPKMGGITIVLSVNYLVAYISGLVTPFTYQNSYNSELKSRLMVY